MTPEGYPWQLGLDDTAQHATVGIETPKSSLDEASPPPMTVKDRDDDFASDHDDLLQLIAQMTNRIAGEEREPFSLEDLDRILSSAPSTVVREYERLTDVCAQALLNLELSRDLAVYAVPKRDRVEGSAPPDFAAGNQWVDRTHFVRVHSLWNDANEAGYETQHPLVPLIKAGLAQPERVSANRRTTGIFPKPFEGVRAALPMLTLDGEDPRLPDWEVAQPSLAQYLPEFGHPESPIVPTAYAFMYEGAGGAINARGRGAPAPLRLFVEMLLSLPLEYRKGGRVYTPDLTLRDVRDWLYPATKERGSRYRKKRDLPLIRRALRTMNNTIARLPNGGEWIPVVYRGMYGDELDSKVEVEVRLPEGSGRGALIDRARLRRLGLVSAPAYQAGLGLAFYWDRFATHKGRRIQPTIPRMARDSDGLLVGRDGQVLLDRRGAPITKYTDRRAVPLNDFGERTTIEHAARERNPSIIKRLPELSDDDLLLLFHPTDATKVEGAARRMRLLRIRNKTLPRLDGEAWIVDGDRILPPDGYGIL